MIRKPYRRAVSLISVSRPWRLRQAVIPFRAVVVIALIILISGLS